MVPIMIDISGVVNRLVLSPEEVKSYARYVLDTLGGRYMELWEKKVDNGLHQTKGTYKSGMKAEYIDDFNMAFILDGKGIGKLGLMIEQGCTPFDIKDGFKQSSKVKHNKAGGWYLNIPLRFATAQAIAESAVFANKMPKPVENIVRKMGKDDYVKESQLPVEFQIKGVRKEINSGGQSIPEYQHKSSIYVGLQHSTKPGHGGYMTFRTAGENSDKNSWIHKGFEAHNFMGKALEDLTGEFPQLIDQAEKEFLSNRE